MARSRKRTPCCHCAGHDGWFKRAFNRRVRREPIDYSEGVSSVQDGNAYRRMNESWDISDMKCVGMTFAEYVHPNEDAESEREYYEKHYIRK